MFSLGIFHDVKLKNYKNVISSLNNACNQTSNLVDNMDNYKNSSNFNKNYKSINVNSISNKRRNQSVIGRIGKNIINYHNPTRIKKKNNEYNKNNGKINKYNNLKNKIFGNFEDNKNYYKIKNNEPYNYNKEYENNLIDEIENLFHPSINTKNNYEYKNIKELMPNNYMGIYSLMENEFQNMEKQIEQKYKKNKYKAKL